MNQQQEQLASLIRKHNLTDAADSNEFDEIAVLLAVKSIEVIEPDPISMGDTGLALGEDANEVLEAFEATAAGRSALAKLSSDGLRYHHPLTQALLDGLVASGGLRRALADKLTALSKRLVSPAEKDGISFKDADELQAAWQAYRLDQKITNATGQARVLIRVGMTDEEADAAWSAAWESV